eukprot:TRINITY_DN10956_c0_g2_i1.p1 TRINITY_DN10956_c0_g2~~TRINITY_DN10956_c0_g2_i1.p1  ORF type:complete len:471 (-),score=90.79 TRINITY_DN10956_c0_g2_i1:198-1610(-)
MGTKEEPVLATNDAVGHPAPIHSLSTPNLGGLSLSNDPEKESRSSQGGSLGGLSSGSSHNRQGYLTVVSHMLFFASTGDVEGIVSLLDEGADVNSADYDGRSALHLAASDGQLEALKLLIKRGARVNPKDRWGHTPLADAKKGLADSRKGDFRKCVELLQKQGAVETGPDAMDWEIDPAEIDLKKSRLIGKGAFGEIRKVMWRGTPVAVKTILPTLSGDEQIVKEFRDEVALLPKLRHPNIVQFLGSVTLHTPLMLVTEYLAGGDLHEVIREHGALPPYVAIAYGLDIARGMNYLHRHKPEAIIHRDLKPRNLLRDEGDHLKVADFGLSKLLKVDTMKEMYKMTGETGSYRYMAPEVFRHEVYDRSVDVYSFSVILYEMFEGLAPFAKTLTAEQVAWKVAVDSVRPAFKAKTYPAGCKELIAEGWSPVPATRPSFTQIIERLEPMERALRDVREGKEVPSASKEKVTQRR